MNRKERRTADAQARKAKEKTDKADDTMVDPRAVQAANFQDRLLIAIQDSGAIDQKEGTIDSHLIMECMAATMVPFVLMGEINEDDFVDNMRLFYRRVASAVQLGGKEPSRIIVPGQA